MKKIILTLTCILTLSAAIAQDTTGSNRSMAHHPKATPEQRAQRTSERLEKDLSLTADQKTKIYNLALTKAQKLQGVHEKYKDQPDQREAMHKELKTIHDEYDNNLKAVLNADQTATFESQKKERRDKAHADGPKKTPEQKAQMAVERLDKQVTLSDDQKTKVYELALDRSKKTSAVLDKYKDQPEKKEAAKSEMKTIHQEFKRALKPVLTPEQLAKLDAVHKQNKAGKGQKIRPSVKESEIPGSSN